MSVAFRSQPAQAQEPLGEVVFHELRSGDDTWCEFRRIHDGIHLRFPALADFVITAEGRDVMAIPAPDVDQVTLDHLQLNQVLPLALSAQGVPVFHASGVEFNGGAIAFLGASGRGKSTLATYLALQGAPLITDDGLVLQWMNGVCRVHPSQPSVRLWQDSQEALVGALLPVAPAVSFTSKARLLSGGILPRCERPVPLRRAFFLGEGQRNDITIEKMGAAEAALAWVKHSFLLDIGDQERLTSHFQQVSQLAARGISYKLDYPRRYDQLELVRAAIDAFAA